MYYIGYILGILLILWLIGKLINALTGKKDKGTAAEPSPDADPSVGGGTGSESYGAETTVPKKDDTGGSLSSKEILPGPGPTSGFAESYEERYIKPPVDMDLPTDPVSEKGKDASSEKESPIKRETSGTYPSEKKRISEPVVRSDESKPDESDEKKTVILYREETGKYRKRCPFCNTYLTSGNQICEVCGSKVSA